MKNYMQRHISKKLNVLAFLFTIIIIICLPTPGRSQKKQLTVLGPVVKIAYLDHSALRKAYKALNNAKEKIAKENMAEKKSFDQALQLLDLQTKELLKQDSIAKGKNRQQIIKNAKSKKDQLIGEFQLNQSNRNQARIKMIQEYERKIILAIESVVNEGGFTDVKPIVKGVVIQNGTNITDLVLKKLK